MSNTATNKGIFISFEGDDGVGKSTHIQFLAKCLQEHGLEVLLIREPGGTQIGEALRDLVLDAKFAEMTPEAELLIYEASRAQIVAEVIRPALARGAVVLCDRFSDSTIAYQAYGRGLDKSFVIKANDFATGGHYPDRTLVFTLSDVHMRDERLEDREELDRLEGAGDDFHARVAKGFRALAAEEPTRVRLINASGAHSQTARAIFAQLGDIFPWLLEETPQMAQALAAFDAEHDHSNTDGV